MVYFKNYNKCTNIIRSSTSKFSSVNSRSYVGQPHFNFKELKERLVEINENIRNRKVGGDVCISKTIESYKRFCQLQEEVNSLRQLQNSISQKISLAKVKDQRDKYLFEAKENKQTLQSKEKLLDEEKTLSFKLASEIPNFTDPSSPIGNESQAIIEKVSNTKEYPSVCLDHLELALKHKMVDFSTAAKVSGSGFYYLQNDGALLEMALVQLAMSKAIENGFSPVLTPDIVREEIVHACGFKPRDLASNQNYNISSHSHKDTVLTATSEIPLAALKMDQIINKKDLPIKKVGLNHCFRAEAGSYGADTRGLYRVHQFTKVELFVFSSPDDSNKALNEILSFQESFFSSLGLHFRVLNMPTEELGSSAFKKFDIEAWLPGQKRWGEISSASNCTDYQSRRLNIRLPKEVKSNKPEFIHTINGTACAIPRAIVAILEQYQESDGSVRIPEVLKPYFGSREFFSLH